MRRAVHFTLNGERVEAQVAPHETLVEVLREEFGLYGARESCGQGLCGCCTVLVDGNAVSSCLYLAAFADGAEIVTVLQGADARIPINELPIELPDGVTLEVKRGDQPHYWWLLAAQ